MIIKRICILIIIIFSFIIFFNISFMNESEKVLLLYDKTNFYSDERNAVNSISYLINHFEKKVETMSIDGPIESLNQYSEIIITLYGNDIIEKKLIDQLLDYENNIMWVGKGINNIATQDKYNFKISDSINNLTFVNYKNKNYDFGTTRPFNKILLENTNKINVYSSVSDGINTYPFIIKDDNLFYASRIDLNEPLFYIFSDVLYDFFDIKRKNKSEVFFQISNVHPFTDHQMLLEKADYLFENDIPFTVSIIPFYREADLEYVTPLSENKDLIRVLQFIQANGGGIITQGSRQYFNKNNITSEDYFTWKNKSNSKTPTVKKWLLININESIAECVRNEIYPIGFDSADYSYNQLAYEVIGEVFDLYIANIKVNNWKDYVTIYPWSLYDFYNIDEVISKNLGIFNYNNSEELYEIGYKLEQLRIVSEYTGGISFDSEIGVDKLENLISFFKEENIKFVNIRNKDVEVKNSDVIISNINNKLQVKKVKENKNNFLKLPLQVIFILVALSLIIILVLFILIFRKSKDKTKETMKKR